MEHICSIVEIQHPLHFFPRGQWSQLCSVIFAPLHKYYIIFLHFAIPYLSYLRWREPNSFTIIMTWLGFQNYYDTFKAKTTERWMKGEREFSRFYGGKAAFFSWFFLLPTKSSMPLFSKLRFFAIFETMISNLIPSTPIKNMFFNKNNFFQDPLLKRGKLLKKCHNNYERDGIWILCQLSN